MRPASERRDSDRIRHISAEELASGLLTTSGSGSGQGGQGGAGATTNTNTGSAARRNRGRRSRGLRRTESGRSIRTLPEYSKEARDEEVVLVRYVYTAD